MTNQGRAIKSKDMQAETVGKYDLIFKNVSFILFVNRELTY